MNNILIIIRKELKHYFNAPMAYVIMIAFLLINGWFFSSGFFINNQATLRSYFNMAPLIMIFFIPAFAMRLIAEEKKQGTIELMVTLPITDIQIVLGKFIGALAFFGITLLSTLVFALTAANLGDLDWGPVLGGYTGLFLMGGVLISIGIFCSSLTSNQIVAFIISFLGGFALFLLGKVLSYMPLGLVNLIDFLGFDSHFTNISKGIIDTRDLLYYFSLIFLMLFLTWQSLLNRKK